MLKSLLNEQEVTFHNASLRRMLQSLVDRLNSEKNTNDYEFIVDDTNYTRINLGYMKLIINKKLNFEKNELVDDNQLHNLNRILQNVKQTEKHEVSFIFNDKKWSCYLLCQTISFAYGCKRRWISYQKMGKAF